MSMPMKSKTTLAIYTLLLFTIIYLISWAVSNPALLGLSYEATYKLSPESRLPRWFSIPEGYDRNKLTVRISYYAPMPPFTYDLKAELLGPPPNFRVLDRASGMHRWHPDSERRGYQANPGYVIASVHGIEEVIEHKSMGPVFYISDDPKLIDEMKRLK
jgi:hypothetical protein